MTLSFRVRTAASLAAAPGAIVTAVVLLVTLTASPARADPVPSPVPTGSDSALPLLRRAAEAARHTPYAGSQFVSSWTRGGARTLIVDVEHIPDRGTVVNVRGTVAGSGSMLYESDAASSSPGPAEVGSQGTLSLLAAHYDVRLAGEDDCAGRPAYMVKAVRPDGVLAARFWIDKQAGILLRREVLDQNGRIVRASAFLNVKVGSASFGGDVPRAMPQPWVDQLSWGDLTALRAHGWTIPRSLPGGLTLFDARRHAGHGDKVVHLSYSDGLSTVSLFVQEGQLDTDDLGGWHKTRLGGRTVYMRETVPLRVLWTDQGHVYTLLADAPPELVRHVVAALPDTQDRPEGFWGRLMRGLARLGSWLNPFG
ncbi:MAG: MucB/RseB C-terminal domain-containing protein [Streptosporangiaceae bacterium]